MHFEILSPNHPGRTRVEDCVRDVYARYYGARLDAFAPYLAALFGPGGQVLCAAGMRTSRDRFFSETYLDEPAERVASLCLARPVARDEIVEISTLAAIRRCATGHFLNRFVTGMRAGGATTLLFTATDRLRTYLRYNGVAVVEVTAARPDRVDEPEIWGSYYAHAPMVCLAPDTLARPYASVPPASLSGTAARQAA